MSKEMNIEERAKYLIKMYVGGNPGELLTKVEEALQAERDDMRERAANRADGSLLVGSEIAKEIRDLK